MRPETPSSASNGLAVLLIPERRVLLVAVPNRGGQRAEIREYALPD